MATVVKDFNSNQRKKDDGKHYHIEFEFGFGGGVWEAERWHNKM